jgi:hypothetical protein
MGAEHLQRLYIADWGAYRVKGTDGAKGTGLNKLTAASVSDWTALGISAANDVCVIFDATGAINSGTYKIASVASGEITLTENIATDTGSCSFRIVRAMKVYSPANDSLEIWTATAGKGVVPHDCNIVTMYNDRVVCAGDPSNPQVFYMSRQGDANDWDYYGNYTNPQRAVFSSTSDAGRIGRAITAVVPGSNFMVIGCSTQLWVVRGELTAGGRQEKLSDNIGIVSRFAWCWGPSGELYFLSRDGVYMVPPGAQGMPQSVSRQVLPSDLFNIDSDLYEVQMAYDIEFRGIHIYLTEKSESANVNHWWFDFEGKGFWPVRVQDNHEPTSLYTFSSPIKEDSAVLHGCRDGYIRRYRINIETDDGSEIESWLKIGPIALGKFDSEVGLLQELNLTLAEDSGPVTWYVYVDETHELAATKTTAFTSGTFVESTNLRVHPRARGRAFVLKLKNSSASRAWIFESCDGVISSAGRQRQ